MMLDINFQNIQAFTPHNSYLVCPSNYCNIKPNEISPNYNLPATQLIEAWQKMLKQEPRVQLLSTSPDKLQYFYVQRTLVFRFPDYISVRFIPLNPNETTLAIYSHAKYGKYDFGVNKKRVTRWLSLLSQFINKK